MRTQNPYRIMLARLMDELVKENAKVHYPLNDVRTSADMVTEKISTILDLREHLNSPEGITMDCSESVTLLCKLVGLGNPNGKLWPYTGNILKTLPSYSNWANANIGAIPIFGPGNGEHATMVRVPGRDPILFSHGGEGGPIYIRMSEEAKYHEPPIRICAITSLIPNPKGR